MKIIAIEREREAARPEDFAALATAEAEALYRLVQQDTVRETYFRADRNEAVLIVEAEGAAEAERILQTLPFVAHGLIEFELIPLRPYPGFRRLFRNNDAPEP